MNQGVQNNPLASRPVGSLILKFSIPAIISMLVTSLYNIVDQIFIGRGVGMLGNAATSVAFPIVTICMALSLLIGIGGAANFSLRSGEGKDEEARQFAGTALSSLVISGVILLVVCEVFLKPLLSFFGATENIMPYAISYAGITTIGVPFLALQSGGNHMIRSDQSPTYSMICMLTGAIINTVLDPLFIFVFKWGIAGAAWATVIGQIVAAIMVVVYFAKFSHVKLDRKVLIPQMGKLKGIAMLGMAASINQIAMAIVQVVFNNLFRFYGAQSEFGPDIPIAVIGILAKVNMIFLAICIGVAQGCQPIFGFNYGAKNYARVRETFRKAATVVILTGVVFFICFQLFPRPIISIFGTGTEEYFRFAEQVFRVFMFMTFINGLHPLSSNFFAAIGKAQLGAVVSLTRQIVFLIPLGIILPRFLGVLGITYAGPIADAAAAIIAIIFIYRQMGIMKEQEKELASKTY